MNEKPDGTMTCPICTTDDRTVTHRPTWWCGIRLLPCPKMEKGKVLPIAPAGLVDADARPDPTGPMRQADEGRLATDLAAAQFGARPPAADPPDDAATLGGRTHRAADRPPMGERVLEIRRPEDRLARGLEAVNARIDAIQEHQDQHKADVKVVLDGFQKANQANVNLHHATRDRLDALEAIAKGADATDTPTGWRPVPWAPVADVLNAAVLMRRHFDFADEDEPGVVSHVQAKEMNRLVRAVDDLPDDLATGEVG